MVSCLEAPLLRCLRKLLWCQCHRFVLSKARKRSLENPVSREAGRVLMIERGLPRWRYEMGVDATCWGSGRLSDINVFIQILC